MGADNTYGEEHWNPFFIGNKQDLDKEPEGKDHPVVDLITEAQLLDILKSHLTDMEHIQNKIVSLGDALAGHKAALEEIKNTFRFLLTQATMNGAIILKPGKHPYLIAGYVVLIEFVFQSFNNKTIRDIEVTDIPVIDVSLFKTIKL